MTNKNIKTIDVAEDFSPRPYGRYKSDGEYSAERFRDEFLIPAIEKGDKFIVDLSGSNRYGSSFLEEAFGGLVREGITDEKLSQMEVFHKLLPSIKEEVDLYIEEARSEQNDGK